MSIYRIRGCFRNETDIKNSNMFFHQWHFKYIERLNFACHMVLFSIAFGGLNRNRTWNDALNLCHRRRLVLIHFQILNDYYVIAFPGPLYSLIDKASCCKISEYLAKYRRHVINVKTFCAWNAICKKYLSRSKMNNKNTTTNIVYEQQRFYPGRSELK